MVLLWIRFLSTHFSHLELALVHILNLALLFLFLDGFWVVEELFLARALRRRNTALKIVILNSRFRIELLHVDNCRLQCPLTSANRLRFFLDYLLISSERLPLQLNLLLFCLFSIIVKVWLRLTKLWFNLIWGRHYISGGVSFLARFHWFSLAIFLPLLSDTSIFKEREADTLMSFLPLLWHSRFKIKQSVCIRVDHVSFLLFILDKIWQLVFVNNLYAARSLPSTLVQIIVVKPKSSFLYWCVPLTVEELLRILGHNADFWNLMSYCLTWDRLNTHAILKQLLHIRMVILMLPQLFLLLGSDTLFWLLL